MTPGDDEIIRALAPSLGRPIRSLQRRPHPYATTHPIEEIVVHHDGSSVTLLFKDLDPARLPPETDVKPRFLDAPEREVETYGRLLRPAGVGVRCIAAVSEPGRHWLFLEKVAGVPLWQIGELDVWNAVARWLAQFHERFLGDPSLRRVVPSLVERDHADLMLWRDRVAEGADRQGGPRTGAVLCDPSRLPISRSSETTLLHGELYPSNVLVGERDGAVDVWPVDWEMAAVGPPAFDLAALAAGWPRVERNRLFESYCDGRTSMTDDRTTMQHDLAMGRLHLALQWLGWSPRWQAPAQHMHDWWAEAEDALEELLG